MAIKPIEVEYVIKDKLSAGTKEAGKSVKGLGEEAKQAALKIKTGIRDARDNINQMNKDIKSLERQIAKLPAGSRRAGLEADLLAARKALSEERVLLEDLQRSYDATKSSMQGLVSEQRQLVQALAQLRLEGKGNTEEYRALAQRAAEITDALGDVRQETNTLAHDNSGFVGVTSGIQGLVGGFTALTGAMSLFSTENEELQRIQTRLQAVMAITLGIQQALDAVNKSSAFSVKVLAKAKTLLASANKRLAAALWGSNVAAQALMATLTLGLSAAITALIVWYDKYTDAQAKAKKAMQERAEVEKDARIQILKSRVELQEAIRTIKNFRGSKEAELRKVKELNQTYGTTFGYYDSLAKWYDVLTSKSKDYVQILYFQAKAQSLINKAADADGEVAKIKATPSQQYASIWDKFDLKHAGYNIPLLKKKEALKEAEEVRDGYLKEANKLQEQISNLSTKQHIGGFGGVLTHRDPSEARREYEAVRRGKEERSKIINETRMSLAEAEVKSETYIAASRIAAMQDGHDKERAQVEHEWKQENQRIEREGKERLALITKLRQHGAKVSTGQELAIKMQADAELSANDNLKASRLKAIDSNETNQWQEYLSRFRDFASKRKAIEEAYTNDVAKLRSKQNVSNYSEIEHAVAEASRQRTQAILSIDSEEAEATQGLTSAIVRLYEDAADKSIVEIRHIIAESEELIQYIKATSSSALQDFNGVSAAQLRLIKADPNGTKPLEDALKRLKKELTGRNPFEGFFASWRDGIDDIKKGSVSDIGKGISKIGSAVAGVMPSVKDFGQAIGDLFGDSELGDEIGVFADGLAGIGSTAAGVGQIMSGDILTGVQNLTQGIGSIVSMANKAEIAHRDALKRVHEAQLAFEREYQLALLRTRLLAEEASNVFGTDKIYKAVEALKVYAEAQQQFATQLQGDVPHKTWMEVFLGQTEDYNKQIEAYKKGFGVLAQVSIVTGHRKTGLFGWGKGEDVYTSLLDVYPQLIKANGELDTVMLKEILTQRQMSEEDRKRLEGLLKTAEVAKEAEVAFNDYLTETFGALGSSMTDALVTSIKEGGDALEVFAKDAGKVLEGLLKQSLFASFFKEQFDEYQKKIKAAYKDKSGADLVSEITKITRELKDSLQRTVPAAKDTAEAALQAMREAGLSAGETASQNAKAGVFATMTQEQGTKLEGLFTSGQMHWASMDEQMHGMTADLSRVLDGLVQIASNTAPISSILQEIQIMRRDGVSIK
ncbi:MAG: hypothetical protein SPI72_03285 [Porphyromonas sp.]|nr:hypothetical protein [Porphyromonas sp.]